MNPEDQDKSALIIAERTRKNLQYIYSAKARGDDVEEFTQLVNSVQSMVVALRENYFKGRNVSWNSLRAQGLIPVQITESAPTSAQPSLKQSESFSQSISHVRHAFSHSNYKLLGSPDITGILLWNLPFDSPDEARLRTWEAVLSEAQLRDLAYLLIDFLRKNLKPAPNK